MYKQCYRARQIPRPFFSSGTVLSAPKDSLWRTIELFPACDLKYCWTAVLHCKIFVTPTRVGLNRGLGIQKIESRKWLLWKTRQQKNLFPSWWNLRFTWCFDCGSDIFSWQDCWRFMKWENITGWANKTVSFALKLKTPWIPRSRDCVTFIIASLLIHRKRAKKTSFPGLTRESRFFG